LLGHDEILANPNAPTVARRRISVIGGTIVTTSMDFDLPSKRPEFFSN